MGNTKKIGNATIMNIDCMEYMKTLPDNYFDLAIVDPPYGIGVDGQKQSINNKNPKANRKAHDFKGWDNEIPPPEYFAELERISTDRIIWGANYYNSFNKNGGAIVWWKRVPPESNLSECEIASYSRLKRVAFVDLIWQNITNKGEATIHPCQKPVKLYEWILTNYAKPGQTIFDSHMGSGSSEIECNNLGFEYVGCELDTDYYEAACKRIAHHASQKRLFA